MDAGTRGKPASKGGGWGGGHGWFQLEQQFQLVEEGPGPWRVTKPFQLVLEVASPSEVTPPLSILSRLILLKRAHQREGGGGVLTPAEEVVPVQMLLLGEHGHHDERVEVDAFAQHPEIVAAQHVHVEEMQDFTAHLQRGGGGEEGVTERHTRTAG